MMKLEENNELPSASGVAVQCVQPTHANTDLFAANAAALDFDNDLKVKFEFDLHLEHTIDKQDVPENSIGGLMSSTFAEWDNNPLTLADFAMPGSSESLLVEPSHSNDDSTNNAILGALKELIIPTRQDDVILQIEVEETYEFLTQNGVRNLASMRAYLTIICTEWRGIRIMIETELKDIKAGIIDLQVRPQDYDIMLRFKQIRLINRYVALDRKIRDLHDSVFFYLSKILPIDILHSKYDLLDKADRFYNAEFNNVAILLDYLRRRDLNAMIHTMPMGPRRWNKFNSSRHKLAALVKELVRIPMVVGNYEVKMLCLKHFIRLYAKTCNRNLELLEPVRENYMENLRSQMKKLKAVGLALIPVILIWISLKITERFLAS